MVMDVDVDVDDTSWGRLLHVRVELDLTKSHARGRFVNV